MKKNIKYLFIACLAIFGLSSCLKDMGYTDIVNTVNGNGVISIFGNEAGVYTKTLNASTTPQDVAVTVTLGSPDYFNKDVVVTLGVDGAALTAYNAKQLAADASFKPYEILPANSLTTPSPTTTIKAGTRDAEFIIKVNTSLLDLSKKYMLPVSITDAQGITIASNLKTSYIAIAVKNQYDGTYKTTGTVDRQGNPTDQVSEDKTLSTIDGTTSRTIASFFNNSTLQFDIVVNPDNTVTIKPVDGAGAVITGTPGKTSTYNPATKTFTLYYGYVNASGLSRVFAETRVKK